VGAGFANSALQYLVCKSRWVRQMEDLQGLTLRPRLAWRSEDAACIAIISVEEQVKQADGGPMRLDIAPDPTSRMATNNTGPEIFALRSLAWTGG
jgi:hypothetical protein